MADVIPARKRPLYMNIMGIAWAVPMLAGPLLGGLFTDYLSWHWAFLITVPLSAISIVAAVAFLPNPKKRASLSSFDAVSYTHLDVYKRQGQAHVACTRDGNFHYRCLSFFMRDVAGEIAIASTNSNAFAAALKNGSRFGSASTISSPGLPEQQTPS